MLAIAALKLGARRAYAFDIDPQALLATARTPRDNGVADRLTVCERARQLPVGCDVLLANILAGDADRTLAPRAGGSGGSGGRLLLAGILERQQAEVAAAFRQWFDMRPLRPARRLGGAERQQAALTAIDVHRLSQMHADARGHRRRSAHRPGLCALRPMPNVFNALLTLSEEPAEDHSTPPTPADRATESQITAALRDDSIDADPAQVHSQIEGVDGLPTQLPTEESGDGAIENESSSLTGTGTFETIVLEGEAITQTEEFVPEESVDSEIAALTQRLELAARESAAGSLEARQEAAPVLDAAGTPPTMQLARPQPMPTPTPTRAPRPPRLPPSSTAPSPRPWQGRQRWRWMAGSVALALLLLLQAVQSLA